MFMLACTDYILYLNECAEHVYYKFLSFNFKYNAVGGALAISG